MKPGECGVCGCTDARGCVGGCVWANSSATLCSRCVGELYVGGGDYRDDLSNEPEWFASVSPEELAARFPWED